MEWVFAVVISLLVWAWRSAEQHNKKVVGKLYSRDDFGRLYCRECRQQRRGKDGIYNHHPNCPIGRLGL